MILSRNSITLRKFIVREKFIKLYCKSIRLSRVLSSPNISRRNNRHDIISLGIEDGDKNNKLRFVSKFHIDV